jgi:hypothetical protein
LTAAGTAINPGTTHRYSVEQAYTSGAGVINSIGSGLCPVDNPTITPGGLNNVVTVVSSSGTESHANACAPVAAAELRLEQIPTLSQWSLILLSALMCLTAFWGQRTNLAPRQKAR